MKNSNKKILKSLFYFYACLFLAVILAILAIRTINHVPVGLSDNELKMILSEWQPNFSVKESIAIFTSLSIIVVSAFIKSFNVVKNLYKK